MMPCIIAGKGEAAIIWAICRIRSGSAAIAAICSCQRSMSRFARSSIEVSPAGPLGASGPVFLPSSAMGRNYNSLSALRKPGFPHRSDRIAKWGVNPAMLRCIQGVD
jgi:hypothetical protein